MTDVGGIEPELDDTLSALNEAASLYAAVTVPSTRAGRVQKGGSSGPQGGAGSQPPAPQRDGADDEDESGRAQVSTQDESQKPVITGSDSASEDRPRPERPETATFSGDDLTEVSETSTAAGDRVSFTRGHPFSFEGAGLSIKGVPAVVTDGVRDVLRQAGADGVEVLGNAALVTALAVTCLDLDVEGLDHNTLLAVQVLRQRQPQLAEVQHRLGQLASQGRESRDLMARCDDRLTRCDRTLDRIELVLSYMVADRLAVLPDSQSTTPGNVRLTQPVVLTARERLRDEADRQRAADRLRSGRPGALDDH